MGLRIDLGCGKNKVEGCIGVDHHAENDPDIVHDFTSPIPQLAKGCAEFVVCRHAIEHLAGADYAKLFKEIARLLEPGGTFEVRMPHPAHDDAMIMGHVHVFTPRFWQDCQKGEWLKPLVIDEIEETPNYACMHFCEAIGVPWEDGKNFLRNAFIETVVRGHKP